MHFTNCPNFSRNWLVHILYSYFNVISINYEDMVKHCTFKIFIKQLKNIQIKKSLHKWPPLLKKNHHISIVLCNWYIALLFCFPTNTQLYKIENICIILYLSCHTVSRDHFQDQLQWLPSCRPSASERDIPQLSPQSNYILDISACHDFD